PRSDPAPTPVRNCEAAHSPGDAAMMATIAGDAAYFQRGSLLWFTVITLSFGYNSCDVLWSPSVPYQRLGPLGYFTQCL
ncbi:Hypothetical predicted protein, partial [Marmota monax]